MVMTYQTTSNNINEYQWRIDFDFVITVCDNAKERCPFLSNKSKKFHQNFPDPHKSNRNRRRNKEQV